MTESYYTFIMAEGNFVSFHEAYPSVRMHKDFVQVFLPETIHPAADIIALSVSGKTTELACKKRFSCSLLPSDTHTWDPERYYPVLPANLRQSCCGPTA